MSLSLDMPLVGVYVGGQTVRGVAELHFPQVIEDELREVHITLRGAVQTEIDRQIGNAHFESREKIKVVNETQLLWTKSSSSYPPATSQVLRIPFEFSLPEDLPPSCSFNGNWTQGSGVVRYFVELLGVRHGLFVGDRCVRKPFSVVPKDPAGEAVARSLRDLEINHASRLGVKEKKIRRGFFGEFANVRLEFSFPDVPVYPLFTPILYTLHITTITKPMKKEDTDKHHDKTHFPGLPTKPEDVQLNLRRYVWIKAKTTSERGNEIVATLGGLGNRRSDVTNSHPINVDVAEKQWIPSDDEKDFGRWKREVTFSSTFELDCSPTFQTSIMTLRYVLELKVTFPGIGNDLEHQIPIVVKSGLTGPPPSYNSSDLNGPPASRVLDLPPSYWGGTDDWNLDEKS